MSVEIFIIPLMSVVSGALLGLLTAWAGLSLNLYEDKNSGTSLFPMPELERTLTFYFEICLGAGLALLNGILIATLGFTSESFWTLLPLLLIPAVIKVSLLFTLRIDFERLWGLLLLQFVSGSLISLLPFTICYSAF